MKKIFIGTILLGFSLVLNAQNFTAGNLAVFVAAASVNNTTGSIVELNTTTPSQPPVNIYLIDGSTLPNALRFSGSATSTGYLALSNDRTLLTFTGANTNLTTGNVNTFLTRGVGTLNSTGTFNLATTYTGVSGQQTRCATSLFNSNWYIGDQNGIYSNGTTTPSPAGNIRGVKSFGGTVYAFSSSGSLSEVSTLSAPVGGGLTGLPGLGLSVSSRQDFYMISSGANGSTYDVLYILDAISATVGTIFKYSLVAGTWTANGSYATTFGGFSIAAEPSGGGANLYVTTGTGATIANSVIKLNDLAGYNTAININTSSNVTLFTTAAGTIIKGITFAPTPAPTPPTVQFASLHQSVAENVGVANVTLNIASPNSLVCKAIVTTSVHTTATGGGVDYTLATDTVSFPPSTNASQNLVVNINDDAIPENAEYISFKIAGFYNGTLGTNQYHILYVRDNDYTPPTPTNELMFQLLGSLSNGAEGANSSEIVAYDPGSQKLVIANSIGAKMDIVDFTNPSSPGPINSITISTLGNINSVAVNNGIIAVALENLAPQSNGKVLFYDMSGTLISQVDVGAMPDMLTFNHAGSKVYVACEGEPNNNYTIDPEGTIAVIDISGGVAAVTNGNVTLINFNAFDSQLATLTAAGVRVFGNNGTATVSQDFEPEYITISDDDLTAWVSLQENNALAEINLTTNTVTQVLPLGTIDHSLISNGMDASDQASGINIANFPIKGIYMPDAITHMTIGGTGYIFTANEGDARAYTSPNNEESRISALNLDPTVFVDQNILKSNFLLGRLNATNKTGDTDLDGDIDQIHVYGGRGFSVWTEAGTLVYNSGNLLEKIIANNPSFSNMFNASNTAGAIGLKNRSDDKGPEIEGVAVANIDGDNYLFASSERIGGVFVFNIDNPVSPRYVGYYNNRAFATNGPDRGAEGIIFISAAESPNGNDLLILANEISSTLTIWQVNTCASLSNVDITYTPNDSICDGNSVSFSTSVSANTNLQWLENNTNIVGETGTNYITNQSGNYSLAVQNTALLCSDTTAETSITVLTNPNASITTADSVACAGDQLTLDASGGTSSWNNGIIDNIAFTPATTDMYVVTVTDANGCTDMDSILVTVNTLPAVIANVTDTNICIGSSVTFTGGGANSYTWDNGVVNNVAFTPGGTNTYIVQGTDLNNCINFDTVSVTVNSLPNVVANVTDINICLGSSVVFTGSGASTYTWNNGVNNGSSFTPTGTNTYTVTGTDINSCSNTSTVTVTVNSLPTVTFNLSTDSICYTSGAITLSGGSPSGGTFSGSGVTGNSFNPNIGYGTYPITYSYTDGNGCTGADAENILVSPCLDIYPESNVFVSVYPNPADQVLYIKSSTNEFIAMTMIDMNGKLVMSKLVSNSDMIDISHLPQGVYVIELKNNENLHQLRIIIK